MLSLLGTGLGTVALGLLAFELAGANAGAVLGTALAIKLITYVSVAPVACAFVHLVPRQTLLVALDLIRAFVPLALPFVTEVWQVYVLIGLLQCGSAAFSPSSPATIPDVLTDEAEYTKALSLSRLAYDVEALVSPLLAAELLERNPTDPIRKLFFRRGDDLIHRDCQIACNRDPLFASKNDPPVGLFLGALGALEAASSGG